MQDLERILAKMEVIVSPNFCDDLAKSTQLVQRSTSQLKGYEFAQSLMIPHSFLEAETLNSLAVRMHTINKSCNLTASALAQRINTEHAERFMKACFGKVLKAIVKEEMSNVSDLSNLSGFNRVLIEDSTTAELHEKLGEHYRGVGGSSSKSSVKIDYIFDYLSEQFISVEFCSDNIPDQSLAKHIISILSPDDLVIRDLGYYALERLKEIESCGAYWISRYKSDIVVYESQEALVPLDLAKFLEKMKVSQEIVDFEVFIGKERRPVRLVYGRLAMILLLGSIYSSLKLHVEMSGKELSSYKLTNYLIADSALLRAFQEGRVSQFIDQLLRDLPRRLCMDKRNRFSLRRNVRTFNSYYNALKESELEINAA